MDYESNAAEFHAAALEPYTGMYMAGGSQCSPATKAGYAATFNSVSSASTNTPDGDEPNERELKALRKTSDKIPWSAFLVAIVELCERFTFYGLSGPFQNYLANTYHDPNGLPGAMGLGQSGATGLTNFFQFWCYVTPVIGAVVSDQYIGKYWTIFYSGIIYIAGSLILFLTSLPAAIEHGASLPGLVVAMVILGIGTGGIKSNISPFIAEQYKASKPFIRTLKSGERVIVDPAATIRTIYMIFYAAINIGSISSIATTELEERVGFWAAYLLPFLFFLIGFAVLVLGKNQYTVEPPSGSSIPQAFKVIWIGLMNKGNLDAAKPEHQSELSSPRYNIHWSSSFVDEVERALGACKVFLFFPIYWVVYSQALNNFVTQAGQMQLHGIPNDMMENIDPVAIIVFIPICNCFLYPLLRKMEIPFKPITRMTWGFFMGAAAMAYAAGVQKLIYESGPCYEAPAACAAGLQADGTYAPNNVHVAIQTPAYVLIGLSEIFASITGLEYAYLKAPESMKSFVTSLFLLMTAFGAALGTTITPTAADPKLLWMYVALAVACFIAGCIMWLLCHKYNYTEEPMNGLNSMSDKDVELAKKLTDLSTENSR